MIPPFAGIEGAPHILFVVTGVIFAVFIFGAVYASRYVRVGPNQALIISGRGRMVVLPDGRRVTLGFRIVKGGGTFVMPVVERYAVLSLESVPTDFCFDDVATADSVLLRVAGRAQVRVNGDDSSIARAAERFLGKGKDGISETALRTIEMHLRTWIGGKAASDAQSQAVSATKEIRELVEEDFAKVGLSLINFTLRTLQHKT